MKGGGVDEGEMAESGFGRVRVVGGVAGRRDGWRVRWCRESEDRKALVSRMARGA